MRNRDWEKKTQDFHSAPRLVICFGALAVVLCWLIITHSFAAYFGQTAPKWALWLNAREATALFSLAEEEINPGTKSEASESQKLSPKKIFELRTQAESALLNDPLSGRNYRLFGQVAELQGSGKLASAAMISAVRHSLHEGYAAFWLMQKALENKNFPSLAYYADVLLRSGTTSGSYVMPALALMIQSKGGGEQEALKLLRQNPPWRSEFLGSIYGYLSDAAIPLKMFMNLRESGTPPKLQELNAYQQFLIDNKLYELAYYVWLQFLPAEDLQNAGSLFNGDFQKTPSGSPFDWQIPQGTNVTVDFAPKSEKDADRALLVAFSSGRAEFSGVSQLTMLTPGRYSIKGSYKSDLDGPRGVLWTISCAGGQILGQSERLIGVSQDWGHFEFAFAVPEKGCTAQSLLLGLAARSPSEEILSGEIWFDDLSVTQN